MISVLAQLKSDIDKCFELDKGNADKCLLITSSKTTAESKVSNIPVIVEEKIKLFEV